MSQLVGSLAAEVLRMQYPTVFVRASMLHFDIIFSNPQSFIELRYSMLTA
jgi:hypothetical protein